MIKFEHGNIVGFIEAYTRPNGNTTARMVICAVLEISQEDIDSGNFDVGKPGLYLLSDYRFELERLPYSGKFHYGTVEMELDEKTPLTLIHKNIDALSLDVIIQLFNEGGGY